MDEAEGCRAHGSGRVSGVRTIMVPTFALGFGA